MSGDLAGAEGDVEKRLAEWQQGDFALKCGDFLYRDVPERDEASGQDFDAVFDSGVEGFAVISQTCDVVRAPQIVPLVAVCPLVQIDEARVADIEKGQAPRFTLLRNTPRGFVVDFSRPMSVSKQLLISWERFRGCESEADQLKFARDLETFFGRYAFPDAFVESVKPLRRSILDKYSKENSEFGKAVRSIGELRVHPWSSWSDQLEVPITFLVIVDEEEDRELKSHDAILDQIAPKLKAITWQKPFKQHDEHYIYVTTLGDLSAAEYLNSYPLDVNAISFAKRYGRG